MSENLLLKQANDAIKKAINDARMRKNDEDRKYIVASIGADLTRILTPLLGQIADNARLTKEDIASIIRDIKVDAPVVNVPETRVNVNAPDAPIIDTKGIEKAIESSIMKAMSKIKIQVPEIKIPTINVPESKVKVEMPKIPEVKAVKESNEPKRIILVDPNTGKDYAAKSVSISSGGGGGVVSTIPLQEVPAGFEQLTISTVAIPLASIPANANKAVIVVEDATLRYRDDGTDPTATVGLRMFVGGIIVLNSRQSLTKFRVIRDTSASTDSEINILYYEVK